jgi:6-phosphofructokinase 1
MPDPNDTTVQTLGPCPVDSPLTLSTVYGDGMVNFTPDDARVRYDVEEIPGQDTEDNVFFEMAGPRETIFFDPAATSAAIVTCGGLCPGLNTVIRSVYLQLYHGYGVRSIYGVRFGYRGLHPDSGAEPVKLTHEIIENIHRDGGTMLGSSRGPGDVPTMVQYMADRGINMLFCVGGDGTQAGAHALAEEIARRDLPISVVGIPKTIDNDISYVERTFGFSTATEHARNVLDCAHNEAHSYDNCVAVVKLMGRHAGFIAAAASVASQDVNFCLVPEIPFALQGEKGLLPLLKERILQRRHALVVVAEGAGQDLLSDEDRKRDASGNLKPADVGEFLYDAIDAYLTDEGVPHNMKYLDPSYAIRSTPPDANDSVLCDRFARSAVHAAMAGKTDLLVGLWHGVYVHVPIPLAISRSKRMEPEGELWRAVLATTGQPARFE